MVVKNLKALRSSSGLTQQDLADRLSVSVHSVRKWEQLANDPDTDTMCRIADLLDVSVDSILGRDKMVKAPEPRELSADELEMLDLYDRMSDFGKRTVTSLARQIVDHEEEERRPPEAAPGEIGAA